MRLNVILVQTKRYTRYKMSNMYIVRIQARGQTGQRQPAQTQITHTHPFTEQTDTPKNNGLMDPHIYKGGSNSGKLIVNGFAMRWG